MEDLQIIVVTSIVGSVVFISNNKAYRNSDYFSQHENQNKDGQNEEEHVDSFIKAFEE